MRARWLVGLALALAPLRAGADDIYLTSGGQLSGKIVSQTATALEVDVGAGRIGVPMSHVVRIEKRKSALEEYEEKASGVAANDVEAWLALGEWATSRGLGAQAREAYNRALSVSPGDPRANAALGRVKVDGRWVGEDESYAARGFVKFEGNWMTPAEQDAILRERAAEAQRDHERRQADQRAREAEARASEAEARAREAEAAAAQPQMVGLPLWYGWGAGPSTWPSGPIVARPITAPKGGYKPVRF